LQSFFKKTQYLFKSFILQRYFAIFEPLQFNNALKRQRKGEDFLRILEPFTILVFKCLSFGDFFLRGRGYLETDSLIF